MTITYTTNKHEWLSNGILTTDCGHPLGAIEIGIDHTLCRMCELERLLLVERHRFHRAIARLTNYASDLEAKIARLEQDVERLRPKWIGIPE